MAVDQLARILGGNGAMPELAAQDWEDLLGQSRRAVLTACLANRFAELPRTDQPPLGPRQHLESAQTVATRLAQQMRAETSRVCAALQSCGLRCVLLKGAAYLCAGLPPAHGRMFSDIDILVPQRDLTKAEQSLMGAGWIAGDFDAYNQRYYRKWMHELPPLTHVHRGSTIDVHHTITPPTSAFHIDGGRLLEAARPIDAEARLWTLQPVDMVLHSAAHLFLEGEFDRGLRDLLDLTKLLRHFERHEPAFWPALIARAQELNLHRPLHHALHHVERLFGLCVPAAHRADVNSFRPPWPQRIVMAKLLALVLRPMHPSSHAPGEGLARWLLYVRSHWLRMPVRLLLPHLVRKAWSARFPNRSLVALGSATDQAQPPPRIV